MTEGIDRYMTEVSTLRKASHGRNKQVTEHFKSFLGDALIGDVTSSLISKYKAKRLQTVSNRGILLSPDTVRKEL